MWSFKQMKINYKDLNGIHSKLSNESKHYTKWSVLLFGAVNDFNY